MATFEVIAQPREIVGKKVKHLRAGGIVPITVYGPKIDAVSLQIPYRPLEVVLMRAGGTNIIDINVGKDTHRVLARYVQRDVIRGDIIHVDFFAVDMDTTIQADIPIHLVNESTDLVGGILIAGISSLSIEALPDRLPNVIEVDISSLINLGDSILVSDLNLAEGIQILTDPSEMLASITQSSAARAEQDEAAAEARDAAEAEDDEDEDE